ncbi:MAG: hypothetical protein ACTHK8_20590 [Ginsengibacter sp.]
MKQNLGLATSIFLFSTLLFFSSCKKDNAINSNDPNPSLTVEAAQSDAASDDQFNDVFNITMGVQSSDVGEDIGIGTGSGIIYRTTGDASSKFVDSVARCFTVTVDPTTLHVFPKTVTIDFGDGCLGKDGKLRKGKIITTYTGPMLQPGSKATTTFENYNVDSFQVEGTHTVTNTSNSNGFSWKVEIAGGKITNTLNGKWHKWDGERIHQQVGGSDTPFNLLDDVFQVTGSGSGSNSNGISWTSNITDPLIWRFTCRYITQGKIEITRNNNMGVVDFGDGTCDNKVTITVNGISYNISL